MLHEARDAVVAAARCVGDHDFDALVGHPVGGVGVAGRDQYYRETYQDHVYFYAELLEEHWTHHDSLPLRNLSPALRRRKCLDLALSLLPLLAGEGGDGGRFKVGIAGSADPKWSISFQAQRRFPEKSDYPRSG